MTDSTALTTTSGSVFSGIAAFEDAQRIAKALATSTLIPPQFQGQQGFANCLVALEIANRMGMGIFQVMQNLHIIHGRPSWSSQFIIALINGCGRFEPLQYELAGKGEEMACRCSAVQKSTGKTVTGPAVSMAMARAEGWSTKAGSKWKTMPELMLRYRAAAMFGRLYVPDLLVGIQSQEEVVDIQPVSVSEAPAASVADLNAAIAQPVPDSAPEPAPEPESDELF